jgi:hypothetical protein
MRNASVPSASLKDMRNVKVSTSSKTNEIGAGLSMILAAAGVINPGMITRVKTISRNFEWFLMQIYLVLYNTYVSFE